MVQKVVISGTLTTPMFKTAVAITVVKFCVLLFRVIQFTCMWFVQIHWPSGLLAFKETTDQTYCTGRIYIIFLVIEFLPQNCCILCRLLYVHLLFYLFKIYSESISFVYISARRIRHQFTGKQWPAAIDPWFRTIGNSPSRILRN